MEEEGTVSGTVSGAVSRDIKSGTVSRDLRNKVLKLEIIKRENIIKNRK